MYECKRGHFFKDDEIIICHEYKGECHGIPTYNHYAICPHCGTDEYFKVETCIGCGEAFLPDVLDKGFCRKCGKDLEKEVAIEFASMISQYGAEQQERIKWGLTNERDSDMLVFLKEAI